MPFLRLWARLSCSASEFICSFLFRLSSLPSHHHHHFLMPIPLVGPPSPPLLTFSVKRRETDAPINRGNNASEPTQPRTFPLSRIFLLPFADQRMTLLLFFGNEKVFVTFGTVAFNVGRSVATPVPSHPICRGISKLPLPFLSSCNQPTPSFLSFPSFFPHNFDIWCSVSLSSLRNRLCVTLNASTAYSVQPSPAVRKINVKD